MRFCNGADPVTGEGIADRVKDIVLVIHNRHRGRLAVCIGDYRLAAIGIEMTKGTVRDHCAKYNYIPFGTK